MSAIATNINIRTTTGLRAIIDQAAKSVGRNRSEFVLEVAEQRAREVLADRTQFELDEDEHARFMRLLDEPLPEKSKVAVNRLLNRVAPWEA